MAEMNIEYPNISDQTPEGQLKQVKDYLFLLADKLNLQDNSAEKVFQEVSKAIDAEAVATTDNEQAAKLREYANLKALIIKTGEYAVTHSEEISKVFNSSFGANSDFGKYYEELERRVTENAQGVEDLFTYTAGINNENGNFGVGTKQFIKSGLLYYDENQIPVFGVGVGVLSTVATEEDEVIDLKQNRLATFAADEIAFWDNGNKVAYISGNAINFPAANIRGGSIHIGEEEHNFFKVDTTGNLKVGDYFSVDSSGIAKFKDRNEKFIVDLSSGGIDLIEAESKMELLSGEIRFKYNDLITGRITGYEKTYGEDGDESIGYESRAALQKFEAIDTEGIVGGTFDNFGLKTKQIILRDRLDTAPVTGSFVFDDEVGKSVLNSDEIKIAPVGYSKTFLSLGFVGATGGDFRIYDKSGNTAIHAFLNNSDSRIIDISETTGVSAEMASVGGNGQFVVCSKGSVKGAFIAGSSGAELRIGGAASNNSVVWDRGDGSHVRADHFHFNGATDGLITGGVPADECSAYIVIGKAKSGNLPVSVIIPSDIAEDYQWQLADDEGFTSFYISNGQAYVDGDYGNGSIIATYSIR